jgi:4'-phosphopantetheinyl transferase
MSAQPGWASGGSATISVGTLPHGEVHVWRGNLDPDAGHLKRLAAGLDRDELARAHRFRFERDRLRFMAGRGLLRQILASYLNVAPSALRFGYTGNGKPYLLSDPELYFNLSHAAEVLVVAVAGNRQLGVDVEVLPLELAADDRVEKLVYCAAEQTALERVDATEYPRQFARLWTRKEAYIKADGRGMTLQLDHIDVATLPDSILLYQPDLDQWTSARGWTLQTLHANRRHVCSLAIEEPDGYLVRCADWPPEP